jgi:hypothetical protein
MFRQFAELFRPFRAALINPDCQARSNLIEHKKNITTGSGNNGIRFVHPDPPLLIISQIADDFDLARLPWCDAARKKVSVNQAKFTNLEMAEVIVDAMPFLLTRLTADETGELLTASQCDLLFCDRLPSGKSAIGVAPGDNLAGAAHIPEVHRRLLLLGKWIGESLAATTTAWLPARKLSSFAWFDNAVHQYLAEHRFPSPFHVSFSEVRAGQFTTSGLHYFTGQEIRLTVPSHYGQAEAGERMAQIIADIVAHGRIDQISRSENLVRGETLIYTPSEDRKRVDILVRRDTQNGIATER